MAEGPSAPHRPLLPSAACVAREKGGVCISSTHAAELHLLLKRVSVSSFCFSAFSVCASPILRRSCPFVLLRPRAACSRSGTCRRLPPARRLPLVLPGTALCSGLGHSRPGLPRWGRGPQTQRSVLRKVPRFLLAASQKSTWLGLANSREPPHKQMF